MPDPDLRPHNPALVIAGTLRERLADVDVLMTDGDFGSAQLRAWQRDVLGQWLCLLRWYATDGRGECNAWFVHDPERVRPMAPG